MDTHGHAPVKGQPPWAASDARHLETAGKVALEHKKNDRNQIIPVVHLN